MNPRMCVGLALAIQLSVLIVSQTLAAPPASSLAVPRDGQPYAAALLRLEADGQIMLGVDGQPRTLAPDKLIRFGMPAALSIDAPLALAADGSCLAIDVNLEPLALKADRLLGDTRRLGRMDVPINSLRGIVLRYPARQQEADALTRQVTEAEGTSDQLILDNGDRLSGNLTALGADKLTFEVEGRPLELELPRVSAIIFNPALTRTAKADGSRLMVGLSDGTRLVCSRAASVGTTLRLTTVSGLDFRTALANVVWLQPLGHDVRYLSDLEPAGYRHTPFLSLAWPYQRDHNVLGSQLRSGGQTYLKGLGTHSTSLLSYTLSKPYRRLDTELGIDDETAGSGSVIYRVYVDTGDGKWQRRYESPVIRGGQKPTPISVDLKGVKRIGLLVDVADRGDELDHANWLDARLVP